MLVILADSIRIGYDETGQGEPLLLIMGLGADRTLWEDHVACWQQSYRCILMDNRGAGESDCPPGPYTTQQMAQDALGLLDGLGVDSAHVAGISMGGAVAQEMALQQPESVRSLVLISSWARLGCYGRAVFEMLARMRAVASPSAFAQLLQLWIYAPPHYDAQLEELVQGQRDAEENPMPLAAFAAQCRACADHDTLDRLERIGIPTLITAGEADIFTPIDLAWAMDARLPESTVATFPGCGHVHHWEDLDRFNRTVHEFLLSH